MHTSSLLFTLLFALCFSSAPAFAESSEDIANKLKASGYLCTDTPDGQGIYCKGGSPKNHIVIPKGVAQFEKTVFYAHGLTGVCGNGASGEAYLKNQSSTLRSLKAISLMPWRQSGGDTSFPLSKYIQRMDGLVGQRPLLLAGHSAAGPFFATELNGNGAGILSRVEKLLIIDGGYGDTRQRYTNVLNRNSRMTLRIVANTTMANSKGLFNHLKPKFGDRVKLDAPGGGHCNAPEKYFKLLAN